MWKLIPIAAATALAVASTQSCKPRERIVGTLRDVPQGTLGDSFVGGGPQAGSRRTTEELADLRTAKALSTILYDRSLDDRLRAVDKDIGVLRAEAFLPHPGKKTAYAAVLADLQARRARVQKKVEQMRAYGGVSEEAIKQSLERKLESLEQEAAAAADALRTSNRT